MIKNLIIYNKDKKEAKDISEDVLQYLECNDSICSVISHKDLLSKINVSNCDYIIVVGGDGTLLGQVRRFVKEQKPIIGINCGHLGFLAEFTVDEFKNVWPKINELYIITRDLLLVELLDENKDIVWHSFASNDAVVTAGPPYRLISGEIKIGNSHLEHATDFRADGIIVSTPLGSTAYNLSAGGPIIDPDSNVVCVTPIASHSLSTRPMIVDKRKEVYIKMGRVNRETTLMIDGQVYYTPVEKGYSVKVRQSDYKMKIVKNPHSNYWKTLKEKMNWFN